MQPAVITSIALVAGIAAAAYATQDSVLAPDAATHAGLAAIDTDHDGRWSKAEWPAAGRRAQGFDQMDTDHDGFLTIAELKAGRAKFRAMRGGSAAQPGATRP